MKNKKLWYVIAVITVLFIVILLLPSVKVENTPKEVKETITVNEADKEACKNWIEGTQGQETRFKQVQVKEKTTNLNEHILDINGKYIQGKGWNEVERSFNCIKDMDGVLGKKHNGLFILQIDGEIIEQDM